ncbi:Transmembrane protein 150A [Larimichthys crocea]|uniref:Uncharacterized protein n=1 Tax=Larimichthys crocea TaxID=215358 RepID=A0ACD3RRT8_LARCR|nr:Transmembrane protein 150A [Larimichthys crocea]
MALYNQHVCPVHNWLYNASCEEPLPLQRSPVLCCTLDNIPLIRSVSPPLQVCVYLRTSTSASCMLTLGEPTQWHIVSL